MASSHRTRRRQFTFQYVSIISGLLSFRYGKRTEFTFQYVSIISGKPEPLKYRKAIYIPICFYYFGKAKITKDPNCKFTFQYVSIISMIAPEIESLFSKFTFQYVSIISCEQCCFFVLKNLFTFQYVSIIS